MNVHIVHGRIGPFGVYTRKREALALQERLSREGVATWTTSTPVNEEIDYESSEKIDENGS